MQEKSAARTLALAPPGASAASFRGRRTPRRGALGGGAVGGDGRRDELARASARRARRAPRDRRRRSVSGAKRARATLTEAGDGRGAARRRAFGRLGGGRGGGKTGAEPHFFLAMGENGPYSQTVFGRGEEFFRREGAVNSDE